MIKVLHIISDSNIGGAGHQLLALLQAMDKASFNMEVVLPQKSQLVPLLRERGVPYTEAPFLAERSFSRKAVWRLQKIIINKNPHIVHTHAALSGRVAARMLRRMLWWNTDYVNTRIVYTRHSVFYNPVPDKKFIIRGWINNFLCDAAIAVSPAARDNLLAEGLDPAKITVIYNGMNPANKAADKAALYKKYSIPPHAFVLAQCARLTEIKGQDYTLDAAKALAHDRDIIFLIAGDGPLQPHLEQRVRDEKINNVRLLGFIDAVDEIFNIMDVQINASYGTEATSLALVSGMSLGKPAIATDYGGNPYVIEEGVNGLLIPCHNAEALQTAIKRLKNDRDLYEKCSMGALKRYEERFTAKKMALDTEALYRKVLER
jgi:glycosyltransferase involved in cell wall biosynthesis